MTRTRILLYFASLLTVYVVGLALLWLLVKWMNLQPIHAYMGACYFFLMSETRGIAARFALRRIAQGEVENAQSYAQGVLNI